MMVWPFKPEMLCWQGLQHLMDVALKNYANENYTPFG